MLGDTNVGRCLVAGFCSQRAATLVGNRSMCRAEGTKQRWRTDRNGVARMIMKLLLLVGAGKRAITRAADDCRTTIDDSSLTTTDMWFSLLCCGRTNECGM
eukprot:5473352-Pyramimonas_sp.AAC.1